MSAADSYDDPFPEIVAHGGFTELEQKNIADLERLMEITGMGGPNGGPILLSMSMDQAKRLQNVLHHALNHGCDEGLRALWNWLQKVVKPALDKRLGTEVSDDD